MIQGQGQGNVGPVEAGDVRYWGPREESKKCC